MLGASPKLREGAKQIRNSLKMGIFNIAFLKKHLSTVINAAVIVIVLLLVISFTWRRAGNNSSDQNQQTNFDTTKSTELNLNNDAKIGSANISAAQELGSGEVIITATAQENTTINEIYLHNPFKNSWLLVYSGAKEVSKNPIEVYRFKLSAATYDKVKVSTTAKTVELDKKVTVQKDGSITVQLDL